MKRPLTFVSALALAAALPGNAFAQSVIETLIGNVEPGADGGAELDIRLLNTGTATAEASLPDAVEARLARPGALGAGRTVMLHRAPATPATVTITPGSFASAHYQLAPGSFQNGALLSVPVWGGQTVALAALDPVPAAAPSGAARDTGVQIAAALPATPPPTDRTVGNAFLENLSAYDPIYAVYGPGTNSEARIQLSFKYQLFGSRAREGRPAMGDGFYFAYTQRMFWDLGADSSPFRNIDFQPELFYVTPPKALSDKTTLSAQIGMRHESNGRDGDFSRSLNTVYIAPMAAFSLGGGTRLTVAPRAWLYAGDLSDNPDIRRYRGNTGLSVEIGQENGLRLSTSSRFNFGSGKGSIAADLSYPLRRILGGGPDFYLFGQTFTGYGENLLDYNRRTTRLRIGVALVR
ncbi:phospholipase A [Novosphingobium barchaimii LL02]|uniref:Phospholipase A1 n=1 Tax=Novosphingobium barchaimii LL02 TaxID=1114963 RepID=A0A0J7XYF6_9SPHN|nr:phospholipase A [Novosphingobium barchaimii]KMS56564.1 phospholipase A [Novosphingobium barchaimii LL02]